MKSLLKSSKIVCVLSLADEPQDGCHAPVCSLPGMTTSASFQLPFV